MPLPKSKEPPMVLVTCQVPPHIIEAIQAEAIREDRTRSNVIRRILKAHFEAADKAVT
jgi:hypothetical protein